MHSMHIQKSLRITTGNNSNRIGPKPLQFYYEYFSDIYEIMNVFGRFDEIYSMALQDIKEIFTYKSH